MVACLVLKIIKYIPLQQGLRRCGYGSLLSLKDY